MGEATDSLLLYLETNPNKLKEIINKINDYNTRRQKLCADIFEDCVNKLKNTNLSTERCIILSSPNWDAGVLGIVVQNLLKLTTTSFFISE
jgi:single-stranded DNA-specific DHH superfamily exonuclease